MSSTDESKQCESLPTDESKEKLSEDLFYYGEKGNVQRCKELLRDGANVNWKAGRKLWYRTPLMQAAKSGMTEVCQLYLEHGADVNACTESHFTAIILAARYGHTETCKLLLSEGAKINNQTKDGETALMWAADHGHSDTCKLLLEAEAKINLQDFYGFTALIRAAKGGHAQTCIVLLDSGANLHAVSTLGNEVWDAEKWAEMGKHLTVMKLLKSHKVLCSLLKDASDPPSYVTLNVCGAVNAGKTTLIQNLQLSTFQRMRRREHLDTSQDMASRTAGIEVGIIEVPGAGVFRKMDMAGHSWAFTSNEYFIGKRTSISLVLFDLSKTDDKVENDLFHHLGMLKARETKHGILRYRPEVVLVATHPDKIEGDPRVRADAYFRIFLESFQAYMNFYPKVMVVNCTDPNNMDFDALRRCLRELRDKIIKNSDRVPRLCAKLLPRIRTLAKKKSSFPVVSWEEFVREVKEINKTADEEGVRNVAFYLNESAEIVNDNSPELRDKVVLDVNWLTSHIFGIALAPANFPRTLRFDRLSGMVGKQELERTFRECPLDQLVELLVRFEVCIPWDEETLICENYLFPSHLEQDRPNLDDVWPQTGNSGRDLCVVGRILECQNKMDALPFGFFPKFQIRLLKRFGHKSPVWYGGIKIADDVVEILATLSSSLKAVNICVWAPKGREERCYDALIFVQELIEELLLEVAGGIEFARKALSIKMFRYKRFEGYPLEEVHGALRKNGPNARIVLESCGVNELAVDVEYCGIRRFVYAPDHITHMTLRDRRELARLLDDDSKSNLSSLKEQLPFCSVPVENEDTAPSGFTSVIPNSETDHYLSRCAVHTEVTARLLMEALERMNQYQAAEVVGRWLRNMEISEQDTSGYRTRGESSASEGSPFVRSRRRGTSEASENWDVCSRSRGGSNASEGSSGLMGSENSVNSAREIPQRGYDSSRQGPFGVYQDLPRTARASSYGSATLRQQFTSRERTTSAPSEHSYACSAEESYYSGSVDRLSCEESQRGSTEQIVPEPQSRCFLDVCRNCDHCAQKLPLQETEIPKPCEQYPTPDTMQFAQCANSEGTVPELLSSPVQVSNSDDNPEQTSKEEQLSVDETGEPDMKSCFPLRNLVADLSSRLSLSWRPVARDLGFRNSDLGRFEESSLLRIQASMMLENWLTNNRCTLDCKQCEQAIKERLAEAFENAHRADLKDFLMHQFMG